MGFSMPHQPWALNHAISQPGTELYCFPPSGIYDNNGHWQILSANHGHLQCLTNHGHFEVIFSQAWIFQPGIHGCPHASHSIKPTSVEVCSNQQVWSHHPATNNRDVYHSHHHAQLSTIRHKSGTASPNTPKYGKYLC